MKYIKVNKKNKRKLKRVKMRNRRLIKKYPWLLPRNVWTDKVPDNYDYSYIDWGWNVGWDRAFGDMFMKELGAAIEEEGIRDQFRILQLKEKYGRLECYISGGTEKIHRIIDKYSYLSENICVGCGKINVSMINDGWYSPLCYKCFRKNWKAREQWNKKIYEEEGKSFIPATEIEIKNCYEKCKCEQDGSLATSYTTILFCKGEEETITYDISETTKKIIERYNQRYKKCRN